MTFRFAVNNLSSTIEQCRSADCKHVLSYSGPARGGLCPPQAWTLGPQNKIRCSLHKICIAYKQKCRYILTNIYKIMFVDHQHNI